MPPRCAAEQEVHPSTSSAESSSARRCWGFRSSSGGSRPRTAPPASRSRPDQFRHPQLHPPSYVLPRNPETAQSCRLARLHSPANSFHPVARVVRAGCGGIACGAAGGQRTLPPVSTAPEESDGVHEWRRVLLRVPRRRAPAPEPLPRHGPRVHRRAGPPRLRAVKEKTPPRCTDPNLGQHLSHHLVLAHNLSDPIAPPHPHRGFACVRASAARRRVRKREGALEDGVEGLARGARDLHVRHDHCRALEAHAGLHQARTRRREAPVARGRRGGRPRRTVRPLLDATARHPAHAPLPRTGTTQPYLRTAHRSAPHRSRGAPGRRRGSASGRNRPRPTSSAARSTPPLAMARESGYDRYLTIFSPEGRLYQIGACPHGSGGGRGAAGVASAARAPLRRPVSPSLARAVMRARPTSPQSTRSSARSCRR